MNWTQISKRGRLSVLPNIYSMEAATTLTNQILNNGSYKKILIALEKRDIHVFVDTESYNQIQQHGLKEIRKNPKIFDHTIQEINILAKEWLHWLKTLNPEDKTNKELIEIYLKYREYYKEIYGRYFTILVLENPLTTHLNTILREKATEENRAQYFTTLTSTIEAMHNKKEERDRLQLALKIKKYRTKNFLENPEINAWIDNHAENYFWITRDYEDQHLTKQDFIQKIHESLERTDLESAAQDALHEEEQHHRQILKIEEEIKLSAEEKEFFRIMRAGIYLKELRKSIVSQSLFHFDKVLNEICKRTDLTIELTRMLLPHDLPALLLDNKPYQEILQKRFNKSVYLIQDGKYIAYTGKEAEKWFSKLIEIDKNITEIKGISASAGIASGPARIVLHPSDFHKIKPGDVMITVQAVPSFLETIKKCNALVADGGTGITSHPATLAREAKIPCVIGAKIATNIIKDGEIIEVDGNNGIIKRITGEPNENKYTDLICVNDEPDMNVFSLGIVLQGLHRNAMKEQVGFTIGPVACEYINKRIIYRVPKKNYQEYGKKAFERIQQDKNIIKQFFEEIKQCNENVHNLKTTNKQEKFDAIYENLAHACMLGYFTVAIELENQLLTNKVSEIITAAAKQGCKRNPQEYFAVLTTPEQESASVQEHIALLELAKKIQNKQITKKDVEKELNQIYQMYCWSNHGYNGPAKSKETYKEQISIICKKNAEQELKNIEKEKQEQKNKQKQFLNELKLSKEEFYFIDCLKYTTATKIVRKDMMAYTSYVLFDLFEEKRTEHDITIDEMQFITPHEARELLIKNKVPSKKELQQRLKHCLYLFDDPKESFLYNKEAEDFLKKHVAEEKIEQTSELKGMAAYLGKVTGRAVIVNTKEDLPKIQQGDILVSYATSPEILPAMKKASAFVTDHGGATCHAAIVAREMKKPCIIGTKYATKIIKDNDVVEVDAYTGIVKKIENIEKEKEIQWKEVASDFNSPLMRNYIWTKAWTIQKKIFDIPLMQAGVKCEGNAIKYIADIDTWTAAHHALRKKLEAEPQWIHKIIEKTNELGEATNKWSEQCFVKKKVREYNSGQLCILLDEYIEKQATLYAYGLIIPMLDFQDFSYIEGNLKKILKEKIPHTYDEAYTVFTAPPNNSFQQDQEEELLELTKEFYSEQWKNDLLCLTTNEIQAKYPQFWEKLESHTRKHEWVYYVYQGPAFTEKEFVEFIQVYLKKEETPAQQLEQIQKNKNKIEDKKQEFLKKIQLTDAEKNILLLAGKVVWAKPRRKDYQSKTYYHVENLYKEIGKRVGCTLHEARSADPEVLKNALQTGTLVDRNQIKENSEFHIVIPDENKGAIIFSGKEARKFHETIEKEKDAQKENEEYWIQNAQDDNVSLYPVYNFWLAAYNLMPEEAGVQLTEGAIELKDNRFYWLCKMPEWENVGKQLTEKTIADKTHFPKLKQRLLAYVKELDACGEQIAGKDVASMTKNELNEEYQKITCAMQKVWGAGVPLVLYDFDYTHFTNELIKILRDKTPQVQEVLSILTTPDEETTIKKEEEAFLKIIEEAQNKGEQHPEVRKALQKHYEQYKWITHSWNGPNAEYVFFENKLKQKITVDIKEEQEKIKQYKEEKRKKKRELEEKLNLNSKEKSLFAIGRDIVFLKAHRKEHLFKALSQMEFLFQEIARQCNLKREELRFLMHEEVADALLNKKDFTAIAKERKKHCVFWMKNKKINILIGKETNNVLKNIKRENRGINQKEITGTCANPGYAEGKVHIVNSPEDMKDFEEGNILVSIATNPMIVLAMKKAAAIITDEGGLTCHAAIVSRELGKPCVIGTKHASKILKNNEQIVVDASKGIITRKTHDAKSKYVAWFSELNNKKVPLVGGKGASLGEMFNSMPVPNGFCITVHAYKEALASILPEINEILKLKVQDIDDLQNKEDIIKAKIAAIQMPKIVEKEIKENYRQIGGKVAVRSSATTEDLADASFAGQQDSYLNIEGEQAVCEAVKKCWASLFNARAIQYREEKDFTHDDAYLAVVVQKMVDAEKAGVMFTANPINNATTEMIIEACFGLGEKLVSGEITPDTFIIDKKAATVKQEYLNHKTKTLQENELKKLIELARNIEQHYEKPMDIEWAIEKGEVYILQARPITTIETEKWITNFSIECAGYQLLHPALRSAFKYAMEICFDEKKHLTQFLAIMDDVHIKNACVKEKEIQNLVNATIQKIIEEPEKIKEIHTQAYIHNDEYLKHGKKCINVNFSNLSDKELAEEYTNILSIQNKAHGHALITTWFLDSYQEKFSKLLMEKVQNICKNTKRDVAETFSILTTLPKNSLATIEEIESLAIVQKIQQSDEKEIILNWQDTTQMPECSFREEMEAHYQKWCWMPFSYLGPAYNREFYFEVWKGLVKENFNAKERMQELQERPEKIKQQQKELIKELKINKEIQTILEIGADIAFLKGYRKDAMYHGMYALSFILKEAAKRLHVPLKDMYLLTDKEISDALINGAPIDSTALYERKGKHCFVFDYETETVQEYRGKHAEEFLKTKKFVEEEEVQVNIFKGTTACSGIAKGIVKIINQPKDMSKMEFGNVLVAHTTMPSLLPAMKKAAAIITEDGGITCHAAIVSRELKIPCITGIKTATKVLKDGMTVEVNASEGIVRIL